VAVHEVAQVLATGHSIGRETADVALWQQVVLLGAVVIYLADEQWNAAVRRFWLGCPLP